jgi:hypothetical protein
VSGELDSNEWLIRELESYDCPDNWAYCSDIAMRAATALHLAEDIIEAKNAEMERLRGIQRAVVALARTVLGKSEHPVERSPWIDVIHMMDEEARRG